MTAVSKKDAVRRMSGSGAGMERPIAGMRKASVSYKIEAHHMIRCTPGQWEHLRKSDKELKGIVNKKLREYYIEQNEQLDAFAEVDAILSGSLPKDILRNYTHSPQNRSAFLPRSDSSVILSERHTETEPTEEDALLGDTSLTREQIREKREQLAINANLAVNVVLLSSKGVAVALSNSISLVASFVDSALDLLSTVIIFGTALASHSPQQRAYPTGKKRFEPLGVLIFSCFMIASFMQVFFESVSKLFEKGTEEVPELSVFGKGTMVATIAIKLFMWIWSSRIKSTGIQALAQDAKNDVFFNVFSLIFPVVGEVLRVRWLDPLGGALLSLYITYEWLGTLYENFVNLSGRVADPRELFRILYLVTRFEPVVEVSGLEVYHVGDELIVEVDIILPPHTSLGVAHDVGEVVQTTLEALDGVSRAYVHLDYSSSNPAQHIPIEHRRNSGRNSHSVPQSDEPRSLGNLTDVSKPLIEGQIS